MRQHQRKIVRRDQEASQRITTLCTTNSIQDGTCFENYVFLAQETTVRRESPFRRIQKLQRHFWEVRACQGPQRRRNCCYQWRQGAPKWYVSVFSIEKWHVVFSVSSSVVTNTPCGVRYVACQVQVTDVIVVVSGRSMVWCALGCSATVAFGCVCPSHVSGWLTSVEVFAVVHLDCLAFCRVAQAFHRGIRKHAAAASCAHVWVGSQWHGCKCS